MYARPSLSDITHMLRVVPIPGKLPTELEEYFAYLIDAGHVLMAISPANYELCKSKNANLFDYEAPIALDYVLEKGYEIKDGHLICEYPYSTELGVLVDSKYDTFANNISHYDVSFDIDWSNGVLTKNTYDTHGYSTEDAILRMIKEIKAYLLTENAVFLPSKDELKNGFEYTLPDGSKCRAHRFKAQKK